MDRKFVSLSIFAGLLIGFGGLVYLNVGGLYGAILFAFGLLSVVMCKAELYTGKAGFLPPRQMPRLVLMLLLNGLGCLAAACVAVYSHKAALWGALDAILVARKCASWHELIVTSAGTGMIMTLAVYGARQKHFLPLLFGVPVFILCGLPHCVADAFYYLLAILAGKGSLWMLGAWALAVVGNYVGCNLPRLLKGIDNGVQ